jgi:hypothetical protein
MKGRPYSSKAKLIGFANYNWSTSLSGSEFKLGKGKVGGMWDCGGTALDQVGQPWDEYGSVQVFNLFYWIFYISHRMMWMSQNTQQPNGSLPIDEVIPVTILSAKYTHGFRVLGTVKDRE